MKNKYEQYRNEYPAFIYKSYTVEKKDEKYEITYNFEIPGLCCFNPKLQINERYIKKLDSVSKYIIFNIGMIELMSYWKSICSKEIIIEADYINEEQINWFKKLYYYGLGELFYKNQIDTTLDDFTTIKCNHKIKEIPKIEFKGNGNLIPIGGGKDSCVTLEILKDKYKENSCFMVNPKKVMIKCTEIAGYDEKKILTVKRILDKKIIELNNQGFINGHTPFSSLVAFISLLMAYENDKNNIVLSNESSANEETVIGTKINHQYSKSYEFEKDFNYYVNTFIVKDIKYFSLLRPINELQIARLFSKYKKYHKVFKSCNLGSKEEAWKWCCSCPKCLFIYIILSPFLSDSEMINIFGEDLLNKEELLDTFVSLIGLSPTKPFECVGSIDDIQYAVGLKLSQLKSQGEKLPFLLQYYFDKFGIKDLNSNVINQFNEENLLDEEFKKMLKDEVSINV